MRELCQTSPPRPEQKSRTVWEVFEEERPSLQALPPRPFDGYRCDSLRVSATSLIRFDRNRYSVEARAAGRVVELRSYADRVRVYFAPAQGDERRELRRLDGGRDGPDRDGERADQRHEVLLPGAGGIAYRADNIS